MLSLAPCACLMPARSMPGVTPLGTSVLCVQVGPSQEFRIQIKSCIPSFLRYIMDRARFPQIPYDVRFRGGEVDKISQVCEGCGCAVLLAGFMATFDSQACKRSFGTVRLLVSINCLYFLCWMCTASRCWWRTTLTWSLWRTRPLGSCIGRTRGSRWA